MSDKQYNLQFEKLCNVLNLGKLISEPQPIAGGLLHRMYTVETTQGKYAVKALNPQIIRRPVAMQHFIDSELIVNIAKNNIPALPAKKFNGTSVQELDNQFYLVFDWIDGKKLEPIEINIVHCEKIGTILADLHKIDFSVLALNKDCSNNIQLTDWKFYLQKGVENNAVWANPLREIIDQLYDFNAKANKFTALLSSEVIISHRDLDSKNVMWNNDNPIIIDWESAGYVNPMIELIETAIYWSEDALGYINKEKFLALIRCYKKRYGSLNANWGMVLVSGFVNKLGWLEYNLKRSLWIECTDEKEQQLGSSQVLGTLKAIRRYSDIIPEIEKWLQPIPFSLHQF